MLDVDALVRDLTPPQAKAVRMTEGPVLILAAAGSGKTRVITRRIAALIALGVPPWNILALTFTNKAAAEMRHRVSALLSPEADHGGPGGGPGGAVPSEASLRGLTVSTFHALCARLLRRYAPQAGLKPDFTIYDSGDQATLVKKVIEACQLATSNFPPRSVLSAISRAKNELLDPSQFAARAMDFSTRHVARIYAGYQGALRAANAVDFDDLLLLTARMLEHDAEVRAELRARWPYLMIDEYQDTNRAQFVIASRIAGDPGADGGAPPNICVVGDPDQAIYGWRGADISNILDFERHYPTCTTITLGENFRSTGPILAVADSLIRKNRRRKHKDLFTRREGGEPPKAVLCRDEHHEAALVADWIKSLRQDPDNPIAWREAAVFYRTNALSRVIEDTLRSEGIPYTIARGTAFYDREEIKNVLAYLRVVANPADDVSLERIINVPTRAIGDTTLDKLREAAAREQVPMLEAARSARSIPGLAARASTAVEKFVGLIDAWTGGGTFMGAEIGGTALHALVDRVIKESGLEAMYKAQAAASGSDADAQRLENLSELVSSAAEFEAEYDPTSDPALAPPQGGEFMAVPPLLAMLRGYLESVALVADADAVDPEQGSVTLMTLHAAKGLEFPAVAMIGLEEGLLPHSRALTSADDGEMEEERRLCFVGITRAMRSLLITASKYRTQRGMSERTIPSRFLADVPTDLLHVSDQSDTFRRDADAWGGGDGGGDDDFNQHDPSDDPAQADQSAVGRLGRRGALSGIAAQFPVGSKVRHPQFGLGVIESLTPGANARATIRFSTLGTKTLILEFARLTRVSG